MDAPARTVMHASMHAHAAIRSKARGVHFLALEPAATPAGLLFVQNWNC